MKKLILFSLLLFTINSYSQSITRGPDIYHSSNFGETISCMDSVSGLDQTIMAIAADKTSGILYYVALIEKLYYSDNYGQYGSWVFRHNGIYPKLLSGVTEGFIFEHAATHSEDYGNNFIDHQVNGAFGTIQEAELDAQENLCYMTTKLGGQYDTLYLFKSEDYYDTLNLVNKFNINEEPVRDLSRGYEPGELYTFLPNNNNSMLRYSNDFGYSWETKNNLYFNNYGSVDFTGGRQPGEVYFVVTYSQLLNWDYIKHIYIYHSLDYGETFTIYHPFSYGADPFYVGFDADTTSGTIPFTVQFIDGSSGENLSYEWDFQNDSIIDSYEQNPVYTYYDTGYFDVKLKITNPDYQTTITAIVKENFIYVKDTTTFVGLKNSKESISLYPNPVDRELEISVSKIFTDCEISLYNICGELILKNRLTILPHNKTTIDFKDFLSGIYFVKIEDNDNLYIYKIIKK